jgi:iron-sulfur cluster repair protein YtfE (RIC family)
MFLKEEDWIELILPDRMIREMLEKRFQITPINGIISFSDWCRRSPLSAELIKVLIHLYLHPNHKSAEAFKNISLLDIVNYVKLSHQYYNTHYLFPLDQFIEGFFLQNEPCKILRVKKLISKFNVLFRAHIIWEENYPIPYIEFLNIQHENTIHSIEECYAIISKFNLKNAATHDVDQHLLMSTILLQLQEICESEQYDIEWQYYYHLLQKFQQDLAIHEFIEDEVLFDKAQFIEDNINNFIEQKSLLN